MSKSTILSTLLTAAVASTASAGVGGDSYVAGVGTGYVDFSTGESNPFDSYISALTPEAFVNGPPDSLFDPIANQFSSFVVTATLIDSDPSDDLIQIGWSLSTNDGSSFYDSLNPATLGPLPSGTLPNAMLVLFGDPFGFLGVPNSGIEVGSLFEFVEGQQTATFLDGSQQTGPTNYVFNPVPGWNPEDWYSIRIFDFGTAQTLQGFEVLNTFQLVPTPGAIALFGLAGIAGRRRRR